VVGLKGKGGGFVVGVVLGFCGSCAFFFFSLSRCSFCILPVYLGAPHAFFFLKFDITYVINQGVRFDFNFLKSNPPFDSLWVGCFYSTQAKSEFQNIHDFGL
jgi:uncharacterized membrane protein